ncbi:hypothetical protein SESBI_24057 [Sesbania bispinosa]|nr:hypothetical protein SESBI_24057 [Sesbania bispinosa]
MKKGLKKLGEDNDAFKVVAYAESKNGEVDIYVEHIEGVVDIKQDIEVVGGNKETEVTDSSNDSVKDIHFSHNEEEKDFGNGDGLDLLKVGEADAALNGQIQNLKMNVVIELERDLPSSFLKKKITPRKRGRTGRTGQDNFSGESSNRNNVDIEMLAATFIPPNLHSMNAVEKQYNSVELDNDLDDNNIDGVVRPKYLKFNKEDLCKTFKFKLQMEFTSLKEFKEAILEHLMLNVRQVEFVKNDQLRV